MTVIDAHAHIWRPGQAGCTWPTPDLGVLFRDFAVDDHLQWAAPLGLSGVILVQSQEDARDTAWLLAEAAENRHVLGVVGWIDLLADDAATRIDALMGGKLCGLRPMLQDREPAWLSQPQLAPAIAAMQRAGLVFDALVRPQHLPALADFCATYPALRVVIDHAAKPGAGLPADWAQGMARLAAMPQVACKLSGLLTETPGPDDAALTARKVLDLFGPDRVIWGSDWPVLLLAATPGEWHDLARALVPPSAQTRVFGGNAARIYGLASS